MRVFPAGLRSSFHPWAEAGPLKGPRCRWTGIPRYPEHRQYPRDPGPRTRPLEGAKGQGPPEAAGPSNGMRQCAVRGPCEDAELQTRGATAVGETKRRGDRAPCKE
jgi:hypothetical protein